MYERKSNLELLRIVSITMIIFHHLTIYGIIRFGDSPYVLWNSGLLLNKLACCLFLPCGEIGVSLFFMLSGFFCIDKLFSFDKLVKIGIQAYFYAIITVLICAFAVFTGYRFEEIGFIKFIRSFIMVITIPVTGGCWWFIVSYVFLMILSPILNKIINGINKIGLYKLILIIWFFWYTCGKFGAPFYILYKGVFFYFLGAYVNKFSNVKKALHIFPLSGVLILMLLLIVAEYCMAIYTLKAGSINMLISHAIELLISAVFIPTISYLIFVIFLRLPEFYNKKINCLASFSLGIYMIHDMSILQFFVWRKLFYVKELYHSPYFILGSFSYVFIIYCVGSIVDLIRKKTQSIIEPSIFKVVESFLKKHSI